MHSSVVIAALSAAASLVLLAGCAPEPEPEPAWTEEEAYAAAEETYREYNSLSLPYGENEDALDYLAPDLRADEEQTIRDISERNIRIEGESQIVNFQPIQFDRAGKSIAVLATVCHDDSGVYLVTEDGEKQGARDNPRYALEVEFATIEGDFSIVSFAEIASTEC
ncbi:hypothetical protein [Microbacterium sp. ZXX196]|uniref:hypothetical protein n=1 Tax=Microbacterium sp. ZXX196 TaxID=2609291 RepID=UPI0012B84D96|nr:hypothetical protein [Microbacterium sp. ZXX196]MTE24776.1 hypothetical protein [Microbacterium sp. ZXX196]